jgi:hypothetical protein
MSEVPTGIKTSGKPEKTCLGAQGYPHVGSFDNQKFWQTDRPIKKSSLDLTF